MKLTFALEYQTIFGEDVVLNVLSEGTVKRHAMGTVDGRNWSCEISAPVKEENAVDYYYSVERMGEVIRHEWLVQPHRLDLSASKSTKITTFDHWIDCPENSYFYSAAFTECGAHRQLHVVPATTYNFTVMLKVRAPQLRANQRLAVVGGGTGAW